VRAKTEQFLDKARRKGRVCRALLTVGLCAAALARLGFAAAAAPSAAIRIVAAENFYADIARQIAGPTALVRGVLDNPDADPHLFEPDISTARAVHGADLIIYNGAGYDPWMERLAAATSQSGRQIIEVAALISRRGSNPHLWYDPRTMPALARALAERLSQQNPAHRADYQQRLQRFLASMQPVALAIEHIRAAHAGEPVTATEPVANDLTAACGLVMRNQRFQLSVMNDTEPGARETAAFERSLRRHEVRLLLYNRQASGYTVQRLLAIARAERVPVIGVTETEPAGLHYQQWMLQQLADIGHALADGRS
jgi:zinc/manganese transport system substrate-binding protein